MPRIGAIHWKKFEKFLFAVGCIFDHEKGDHRVYWKEGIKRPIVVPRYAQLPDFIILNNLKILGVNRKKYLAIIAKL